MLPKYKNKNSWILSVKNKEATKYNHYFYCTCSKEFKLQTKINEPEAPDVLCPMCGNNYFKDAVVFAEIGGTKIWKYFKWITIVTENKDAWSITLKYDLPIYNNRIDEVKLCNQDLLHIKLKKDGSSSFKISYKSKIISRYSLFLDDKVQSFKKLLSDESKENLYKYIMSNKSENIMWINSDDMQELPIDDKLKYITYFLENSHLKEHRFYFWRMDNLHNHTIKYTTQEEMLNFIVNHRKAKSIKKALYAGYEDSIDKIGYYPYSDYIFSRTIENIDLLSKLYGIYPAIKQHLFTDGTFSVGIEFILFLKKYYTEKQITRFFIEYMQDEKEYRRNLLYWKDTLRMLQTHNAFTYLEQHFTKIKFTIKKLHDEIVRVFHLVTYELDSKEVFEYDNIYLSACGSCKDLKFELPSTAKELSLWSKVLRNCMFSYTTDIHKQFSIIYGVSRDDELLYAVEISDFRIVQAKAVLNRKVPNGDMETIKDWKKTKLIAMQT